MLILDPPSVLTFRPPFSNKTQCYISVKNPTPYGVYFKLKTTACHRYCVKPKMGRILPYGDEVITVRLKAPRGEEQDKFKLLSFVALNNSDSPEVAWEKFDERDAMTTKFIALFLDTEKTPSRHSLNVVKPHESAERPPVPILPPKTKIDTPQSPSRLKMAESDVHKRRLGRFRIPGLKLISLIFIAIGVTVWWVGDIYE